MLAHLDFNLYQCFVTAFFFLKNFFLAHYLTLSIILICLFIVSQLLKEKNTPSYTFAWLLVIIFLPFLGIPLYFFFGGRKSKRLLKNKKHVLSIAAKASGLELPQNIAISEWNHNSFTLLQNGEDAFHAFCNEIRNAQKSIYIMTYILRNDSSGKKLISLIAKKAQQGVEVKLLLDALGNFGHVRKAIQPLLKTSAKVAQFIPLLSIPTKTSANLRNHRKIAIFDHHKAIIGGQNLDFRFLGESADPRRFHDFSALLEGPIAQGLTRVFLSDWCFAANENPIAYQQTLTIHPTPVGDQYMKLIASGPDSEEDPLWEHLIYLIQESRKHITIITPYFIPDKVLFYSLLAKARSNVTIELIVPKKSNLPLADLASHYYLRQLHKAGVKILLYTPKMLHAKLFIADNTTALMGSANMDIRSFFVNFEIGLILTHPSSLQQLTGWADSLRSHCISYENSIHADASKKRRLAEDISHLLLPLL